MKQYKNHPLVEAARYNDASAEEHGFDGAIEQMGLDVDALLYAARQRSLRIVLLSTRGPAALKQYAGGTVPTVVPLSELEESLVGQFTLASLDGICIGWKASSLDERPL